MTAFSTLNVLPPAQLTNLNELGYLTMTPVQAAALPAKLTVPMIIFFLPVLFVVILGPAIINIQDTMAKGG